MGQLRPNPNPTKNLAHPKHEEKLRIVPAAALSYEASALDIDLDDSAIIASDKNTLSSSLTRSTGIQSLDERSNISSGASQRLLTGPGGAEGTPFLHYDLSHQAASRGEKLANNFQKRNIPLDKNYGLPFSSQELTVLSSELRHEDNMISSDRNNTSEMFSDMNLEGMNEMKINKASSNEMSSELNSNTAKWNAVHSGGHGKQEQIFSKRDIDSLFSDSLHQFLEAETASPSSASNNPKEQTLNTIEQSVPEGSVSARGKQLQSGGLRSISAETQRSNLESTRSRDPLHQVSNFYREETTDQSFQEKGYNAGTFRRLTMKNRLQKPLPLLRLTRSSFINRLDEKSVNTSQLPVHKRTSVQYSSLVGPSFINTTYHQQVRALAGQTALLACVIRNLHNYTVRKLSFILRFF